MDTLHISESPKEVHILASFCFPHVSSANFFAYSGSSQIRMLSNKVPDFTWYRKVIIEVYEWTNGKDLAVLYLTKTHVKSLK